MAEKIFIAIVVILIFDFVLERTLSYLNATRWSKTLPTELEEFYDEEKYAKAQDYGRVNQRFGLLTSTISFVGILVVLLLDGFAWLDTFVRQYTQHPILMAGLFFGTLGLVSDIVTTPLSAYHTFVIEEKFGFNKTTWKTFVLDKLKGWLLAIILGGAILSLVVWFWMETGSLFWLYAWGFFTVFSIFMAMFYTSCIVPLFNKLTPLEEGELRTAIEQYANSVGFELNNIFVIDGSKRSTKANAYFSGFGPKKTIVLFDTLIEKHTTKELVAVLAHEVGHYKKKHVVSSLTLGILQTGVMLFVLGYFINSPYLAEALGASQPSFHLGVIAFGMLYSPVSTIFGVLMNVFSRKNEFEADEYASQTSDGKALQIALKKLSVDNLSNLTPHPAYVFFHYSHPPLLQRLKALTNV